MRDIERSLAGYEVGPEARPIFSCIPCARTISDDTETREVRHDGVRRSCDLCGQYMSGPIGLNQAQLDAYPETDEQEGGL